MGEFWASALECIPSLLTSSPPFLFECFSASAGHARVGMFSSGVCATSLRRIEGHARSLGKFWTTLVCSDASLEQGIAEEGLTNVLLGKECITTEGRMARLEPTTRVFPREGQHSWRR